MEVIEKYFPDLTAQQLEQFEKLGELYQYWNDRINVVSRKDLDQLYVRHILHSLAIGKFIAFQDKAQILDVGTGGGFPGVPLAILFPEAEFTLIDSIGKKIKVVNAVANDLGLTNCKGKHLNAKLIHQKFDFVVSRAVTRFDNFLPWVKDNFKPKNLHSKPNGIIYLKGGDLTEELKDFKDRVNITPISNYYVEDFFKEKVIIHYY